MNYNDISILKQKHYSDSYYHQDTYVVGNSYDRRKNENQTLLTSLQNLIQKTNFNFLEISTQSNNEAIQKKIIKQCYSDKHYKKASSQELPKIDNQSFSFQDYLQDQCRSSLSQNRHFSQNEMKISPGKQLQFRSKAQSPFLSSGISQTSNISYIFDTKEQNSGLVKKSKKQTLKDKLLKSYSINKLPKIKNIDSADPKKSLLTIKKQHLLMEKDNFQEYVNGLKNSNVTMNSVMNQLIKRKQLQQEKKKFIEKLQEKDEMSRISKSLISHTTSNSTSRSKCNNITKTKTFLNRLSIKALNLNKSKESNTQLLQSINQSPKNTQLLQSINQSPKNYYESPIIGKNTRFASEGKKSMQLPQEQNKFIISNLDRRSMMNSQKSVELRNISQFTQKIQQNSIAPALQKLIFKQPLKKYNKKEIDDSESNDDEYMDDVDDLQMSKINKNYFKKRMNSLRNDAINLQSQLGYYKFNFSLINLNCLLLGQYLEEVKQVSDELKNQLDQVVNLYQNEQRTISVIQDIISELQKNGLPLYIFYELNDLFFSQDQKKLKQSSLNITTIANHVAKQKVRQYDQDGNVLPPKVNMEMVKALEEIAKQLKKVIYQKKVMNLKASEYETKQQIIKFTQLKDSYLQTQDPTKQEEISQILKKYQESRTLIGPECRNYNLQPLIEYFRQKFKYNINLDFDKQERKINENIENIILNIKKDLYQSEMPKFNRKKKEKKKKGSQSNIDSDSSSSSSQSQENSTEINNQ